MKKGEGGGARGSGRAENSLGEVEAWCCKNKRQTLTIFFLSFSSLLSFLPPFPLLSFCVLASLSLSPDIVPSFLVTFTRAKMITRRQPIGPSGITNGTNGLGRIISLFSSRFLHIHLPHPRRLINVTVRFQSPDYERICIIRLKKRKIANRDKGKIFAIFLI